MTMMTAFDHNAISMPPPPLVMQQRLMYRPADAISVVSESSVYGGAMDPVSTTLRGLRKALRLTRNEYVAALKHADTLEEDDMIDFRGDLDGARKQVWLAAWRLVSHAKAYADAESGSDQDKAAALLSTTESSLVEVRNLWNATYYFDKQTFKLHLFLPSYENIHDESPETGAKRALEMTTGSTLQVNQPLRRRRTSTPNVTDDTQDDDLALGAEADNHQPDTERRNAPPHVPAALEYADHLHVNFEPATPGTTARTQFISARDDEDDDDDDNNIDAMDTSRLHLPQSSNNAGNDAARNNGAVGGVLATRERSSQNGNHVEVRKRTELTRQQQEAKRKAAEDRREREEREAKKKEEREKKAEEARKKATAKKEAEQRKKGEEKKKEEERKRREEEEKRGKESQRRNQQSQSRAVMMRTLPQILNEHPLNEELRVRQHATDDARRNAMTHADAMAQVQQLIADLQLEDSVVLRMREQRHPAPLSSPSSPVVVDHIPGDLPTSVNHEVFRQRRLRASTSTTILKNAASSSTITSNPETTNRKWCCKKRTRSFAVFC